MDLQTLKLNDQGQNVTLLQQMLNKAGGYGLVEDGIFGQNTYNAVKRFQESQGISVDGIVGESTWAALQKSAGTLPATTGAVNWKTLGMITALAIGAYMLYKRMDGFAGSYDNEEDEFD